jgi:hypothetical protein
MDPNQMLVNSAANPTVKLSATVAGPPAAVGTLHYHWTANAYDNNDTIINTKDITPVGGSTQSFQWNPASVASGPYDVTNSGQKIGIVVDVSDDASPPSTGNATLTFFFIDTPG